MKNKLLIALFICAMVLSVTGCGKKAEETKKVTVKGPRVVCKMTDDSDGMKTSTTAILKFNEDNYVNYELHEITIKFADQSTFDYYADATKENADSIDSEDLEYSYSIDKANKTITTTMIYKESLFDYSLVSDEDKADYLASVMITSAEDNGATCEFIELTRSDLGLE